MSMPNSCWTWAQGIIAHQAPVGAHGARRINGKWQKISLTKIWIKSKV
jgi:hypothetical protein